MNISVRSLLTFSAALFFLSCSIIGGDDAPTFLFTADVNPADGGTVSPDSAFFEEGATVQAQAVANSGFQFDGWSGDETSDQSTLSFTIIKDTDVRANFSRITSRYQVDLTVADSTDSIELRFGQSNLASDGFDSGMDKESPPPPPEGALHSFFRTGNMDLLHDFRSETGIDVSWDLNFQIGTGSELQISWTIEETRFPGTLTLRNDDSSINVNMGEQSSVSVPVSDAGGSLIIEYKVE